MWACVRERQRETERDRDRDRDRDRKKETNPRSSTISHCSFLRVGTIAPHGPHHDAYTSRPVTRVCERVFVYETERQCVRTCTREAETDR